MARVRRTGFAVSWNDWREFTHTRAEVVGATNMLVTPNRVARLKLYSRHGAWRDYIHQDFFLAR